MIAWFRLVVGFFILSLVVFGFVYFAGPESFREAFHSNEPVVGQVNPNERRDPGRDPASVDGEPEDERLQEREQDSDAVAVPNRTPGEGRTTEEAVKNQ